MSGKPKWTQLEVELAVAMRRDGAKLRTIAAALGKSLGATQFVCVRAGCPKLLRRGPIYQRVLLPHSVTDVAREFGMTTEQIAGVKQRLKREGAPVYWCREQKRLGLA